MIKDFVDGRTVEFCALCSKKSTGTTKRGTSYYSLELRDRSGTIAAKIWNVNAVPEFSTGDVLFVTGDCNLYEETLQVTISSCSIAAPGSYKDEDLYPCTDEDPEALFSELMRYVNSVSTSLYSEVLHYFFDNEEYKKLMMKHSAAVTVHHAFMGGWMQHTLNVTRICFSLLKIYPSIRGNLLITAALLHDIGKLREISSFPANNYTQTGYLVGHITEGFAMVRDAVNNITVSNSSLHDENKAQLLYHCILSHHGELEYGSPKKPAIIEAVALSFADNTDAKIEIAKEMIDSGKIDKEPAFNKYLGTYFCK